MSPNLRGRRINPGDINPGDARKGIPLRDGSGRGIRANYNRGGLGEVGVPKRDGSGRGIRANYNRGGCREAPLLGELSDIEELGGWIEDIKHFGGKTGRIIGVVVFVGGLVLLYPRMKHAAKETKKYKNIAQQRRTQP